MRRALFLFTTGLAVVATTLPIVGQDAKLERGKYLVQTAKNPRGGKAGPPMPAYMLKAEDADAIAVYLKSLP